MSHHNTPAYYDKILGWVSGTTRGLLSLVYQENLTESLFIKGNETTEGSIKLEPNATGDNFVVLVRTAGVWTPVDQQVTQSDYQSHFLLMGA